MSLQETIGVKYVEQSKDSNTVQVDLAVRRK
jgi:hypothetical protein